ncbi:glycosyltransferase family 39 protein, partial [bacterium]|nr:glycosyltransferase family 39 protein [bacterium]
MKIESSKKVNILAGILLGIMFFTMFFSMLNDSATMDELAHIPAGYSYIIKKDMRLNPEHPPLLKDLAGISILIFSKITHNIVHFPENIKAWKEDINGQWDFGGYFLYNSKNDADKIIFFARLPFLILAIILGIYIFKWTKQLYGNKAGLIALFLYSFSPTFLAHSRLVTTDLGASAGFFISTYYLIKWLKNYNKKSYLILAGIVFGLSMLVKFSLALTIPYFIILVIFWSILYLKNSSKPSLLKYLKNCIKMLSYLLLIGIIGMILVWCFYQYHTFNYPKLKQKSDTSFILTSFGNRTLANLAIWMADKPILRPFSHFLLGLFMTLQRAAGGNTEYFLGEISAAGWWYYFPVIYLLKVPLAFHILTLLALLYAAWKIKQPFWKKPLLRVWNWMRKNFEEFAMLFFVILYWAISIKSNLNIGLRHILPTFPFLYVLVSGQITKINSNLKNKKLLIPYHLSLITLLFWYAFSSLSIYPHYLAYFNELIGGAKNGYKYAVDSNLDWGQDLKRLTYWVNENNIKKIYVDYFGGGSVKYYLKEKYLPWWGDRN